jgi:hypothetical protein
MEPFNLKWSKNNTKLKKTDTISFNLPAFKSEDGFKVCPKAGACATLCYARQGHYVVPVVSKAREFNLKIVRGNLRTFIRMAIEDLSRVKNKTVRVHDSGDFFSQDYLDSWLTIAKVFPKKKFYAYTKSLHLDFSRRPDNFQIVQSVGGLMDDAIDPTKSHSRIFATHKDRKDAGYINGNLSDAPAIKGERAIGLVYHGTKNLKEGQIRWLKLNVI